MPSHCHKSFTTQPAIPAKMFEPKTTKYICCCMPPHHHHHHPWSNVSSGAAGSMARQPPRPSVEIALRGKSTCHPTQVRQNGIAESCDANLRGYMRAVHTRVPAQLAVHGHGSRLCWACVRAPAPAAWRCDGPLPHKPGRCCPRSPANESVQPPASLRNRHFSPNTYQYWCEALGKPHLKHLRRRGVPHGCPASGRWGGVSGAL